MNTRRCELCGTLHGKRYGSVTLGIPREDVGYTTHDHYNLCETCSLQIYDAIDKLKISDGQIFEKQSAMVDLIQRQNAEISKIRMYARQAYNHLMYAMKRRDTDEETVQHISKMIEIAMENLYKAEPYEEE